MVLAVMALASSRAGAEQVRNCVVLFANSPGWVGLGGQPVTVDLVGERGSNVTVQVEFQLRVFEPIGSAEYLRSNPAYNQSRYTLIVGQWQGIYTLADDGVCLGTESPSFVVSRVDASPLWNSAPVSFTRVVNGNPQTVQRFVWNDTPANPFTAGSTLSPFSVAVPTTGDPLGPPGLFQTPTGFGGFEARVFGWHPAWGDSRTPQAPPFAARPTTVNGQTDAGRTYWFPDAAGLTHGSTEKMRRVQLASSPYGPHRVMARYHGIVIDPSTFTTTRDQFSQRDRLTSWLTAATVSFKCSHPMRLSTGCNNGFCDWVPPEGPEGGSPPSTTDRPRPEVVDPPEGGPEIPTEDPVPYDPECLDCPLLAQVVKNTGPLREGFQLLVDKAYEEVEYLRRLWQEARVTNSILEEILLQEGGGDPDAGGGTPPSNDPFDYDGESEGEFHLPASQADYASGVGPDLQRSSVGEIDVFTEGLPIAESEFSIVFDTHPIVSQFGATGQVFNFNVDLGFYAPIKPIVTAFVLSMVSIWAAGLIFEEFRRY
jgi:hypothetical protein